MRARGSLSFPTGADDGNCPWGLSRPGGRAAAARPTTHAHAVDAAPAAAAGLIIMRLQGNARVRAFDRRRRDVVRSLSLSRW